MSLFRRRHALISRLPDAPGLAHLGSRNEKVRGSSPLAPPTSKAGLACSDDGFWPAHSPVILRLRRSVPARTPRRLVEPDQPGTVGIGTQVV